MAVVLGGRIPGFGHDGQGQHGTGKTESVPKEIGGESCGNQNHIGFSQGSGFSGRAIGLKGHGGLAAMVGAPQNLRRQEAGRGNRHLNGFSMKKVIDFLEKSVPLGAVQKLGLGSYSDEQGDSQPVHGQSPKGGAHLGQIPAGRNSISQPRLREGLLGRWDEEAAEDLDVHSPGGQGFQ